MIDVQRICIKTNVKRHLRLPLTVSTAAQRIACHGL
jgi:hypothetical protein